VLQLSLCWVAAVIQLTSSQQLVLPLMNVCSGEQAEKILSVLSQLTQCCSRVDQMVAQLSWIETAISQLHADVTDIKTRPAACAGGGGGQSGQW